MKPNKIAIMYKGVVHFLNRVTGGSGYGLNVWGKIFDNRKDCLKAALNEMLTGLEKDSSKTDRYAINVLKQAKALFDEITGRKPVQLELSFF